MVYNGHTNKALDLLHNLNKSASLGDVVKILRSVVEAYRQEDLKDVSPDDHIETMSAVLHDLDGYCHNAGEPIPLKGSWYWFAHLIAVAVIYD